MNPKIVPNLAPQTQHPTNMEVITLESKAFEKLMLKIEDIQQRLTEMDSGKVKRIAEEYLDSKEACRALKCSMRTLHNYKDKGLLRYIKREHKLWFRVSDIEAFLNHKGEQQAQ